MSKGNEKIGTCILLSIAKHARDSSTYMHVNRFRRRKKKRRKRIDMCMCVCVSVCVGISSQKTPAQLFNVIFMRQFVCHDS